MARQQHRRAPLVLWSSLAAAWIIALVDCVVLARASGGFDTATRGAAIAAVSYGTLLGLGLGAVAIALSAGRRRLGRASNAWVRRLSLLAHPVTVLAVPWIAVSYDLTTGPAISASAWRIPVLIGFAASGVGGIITVHVAFGWVHDRSRALQLIASAGLIAGASIAYASQSYFPNSYYAAHAFALLMCLIAVAMALAPLLERLRSARGRLPIAVAVAAGIAAATMTIAVPLTGAGRAAAYRYAQTVRHVIYLSSRASGSKGSRKIVYDSAAAGEFEQALLPVCDQEPLNPYDVIFISVDSLRGDRLNLESGDRRVMPNIDRLGERGLSFTAAYAPSPSTSTSLIPLLSGSSALALREQGRIPSTLASELESLGYRTVSFAPFGSVARRVFPKTNPKKLGFDEYIAVDGAADFADRVIEGMAVAGDKPMFIYAHLMEPHASFKKWNGFDFGSTMTDRYDSEVAYVDHQIGRIIDEVAKRGRTDRTVFAITADHGEAFYEHGLMGHGRTLYEEMTHVPLVIAGPGIEPAAIHTRTSGLDIAPTLLATVGCGWSTSQEGHPLWAGGIVQPPSFPVVVRQYDEHDRGRDFVRRVATYSGDHKLIEDVLTDVHELYDLAADPLEKSNLISEDTQTVSELRAANLHARRRIAWVVTTNNSRDDSVLSKEVRRAVPGAARKALERIVGNREAKDKRQLIAALEISDDDDSIAVLEQLVRSDKLTPDLSRRSARALAKHRDDERPPAVAKTMMELAEQQLARGRRGLGRRPSSKWAHLAASPEVADPARVEIVSMLVDEGGNDLAGALRALVDDDSSDAVSAAAAVELCRLAPSTELNRTIRARFASPEELSPLTVDAARGILRCLGRQPLDDDIDYLSAVYDTDVAKLKHSVYIIIEALGRARNDRPVAKLAELIEYHWEPIRAAAFQSLTELDTPRAAQLLVDLARTNRHLEHDPVLLHSVLTSRTRMTESIALPTPIPLTTDGISLGNSRGASLLALHLRRVTTATRPGRVTLTVGATEPVELSIAKLSEEQPEPIYFQVDALTDDALRVQYSRDPGDEPPLEVVAVDLLWL